MHQFFVRRWFLLALGAAIALGFLFPGALSEFTDQIRTEPIVAVVLFVMMLPLEITAMGRAFRRPGPVALAVAVNYGLLPPFAWLVSRALPAHMSDIAIGLVVMASIPCTLASAAVWTRRAGGNDAVAILVTLITNGACFLVTPAWLLLLTGTKTEIDFGLLVGRLALIVVLPMVIAQLFRLRLPVARWATANKIPLGVLAQCGILIIVLIGATRAGVQLSSTENGSLGLLGTVLLFVMTVGVHVSMLWLGHFLSRRLRMDRADRIAVGFASSQKTMMVGLYVCLTYYDHVPLAILPMVVYHVGQLLIDTLVADRLRMG